MAVAISGGRVDAIVKEITIFLSALMGWLGYYP